jgi:hypothetical protein
MRPASLARAMSPRAAPPVLVVAAAVAGCGGSDKPVQLPAGGSSSSAATVYKGRTSQGQAMKIEAAKQAKATVRFELRCKDGSQTEATLTTEPRAPALQSDGSFYYSETGRTNFRGFGDGRYRTALAGQLAGPSGSGTAVFRISFKSTACRANARWQVKHS